MFLEYPKNKPFPHLATILPRASCSGPFVDNLYRTVSPNPTRRLLKGRPLIRCQAVFPSLPRRQALGNSETCSSSQSIIGWSMGILQPSRFSRPCRIFLKWSLKLRTATSVAPLDCESYLVECSCPTLSKFSTSTRSTLRLSVINLITAGFDHS